MSEYNFFHQCDYCGVEGVAHCCQGSRIDAATNHYETTGHYQCADCGGRDGDGWVVDIHTPYHFECLPEHLFGPDVPEYDPFPL